jgi:hypothetical protein
LETGNVITIILGVLLVLAITAIITLIILGRKDVKDDIHTLIQYLTDNIDVLTDNIDVLLEISGATTGDEDPQAPKLRAYIF